MFSWSAREKGLVKQAGIGVSNLGQAVCELYSPPSEREHMLLFFFGLFFIAHYGTNEVNQTDVCLCVCPASDVTHEATPLQSTPTQSRHEASALGSPPYPADKSQIAAALGGL